MLKDTRKIAAILAADVVDYSRLMGADEEGTLAALTARRSIFDELVKQYDGREFGSVGDSLMAEFSSAVNAVRCAQAIQDRIAAVNAPLPAERRMALRIGINLGDVIEQGGALFGDGVNVAARLQSLASPGGVLISGAVHEHVRGKLTASFSFVGERQVKNIAEPVRVYEVSAPVAASLTQRIGSLLRRRVVIAGAIYVLAAGLLVWVLTRFPGTSGSASWLVPALITLLAAGFVPAMTVAWQSDARHRMAPWIGYGAGALGTALCCTIVWFAWTGYLDGQAKAAIARSPVKAQPVVAVAAFQNLTGDPKLGWLSEGIASLVRDGLAESSHLVVVSPTRWHAVLRNQANGAAVGPDAFASAQRAGIDYVVSGEFLSGPDGLVLTARVSDLAAGVEIAPDRADKLTPQTLLGEAGRLVMMTKRGLNVPHTENVASFSADFAVNNIGAYETYLAGIEYFLKFDYRSAERAFRSALDLAPQFHMARYRLAYVQVASGDTEAGLATLDGIPADAALTRRERLYVDGAHALFARDAARAKEIYRGMLKEFPFDVEARWFLAQAYDLAFEDDDAIKELKRLLDQEPENDYVWSYLGETYLRLGDYDLSRQALAQYLKTKPHDPYGFTVLGQLDQLTGNTSGAADNLKHALELEPGFATARIELARTQVLRGVLDDAEHLLRSLAADRDVPAAVRIDAAFDLSGILRAQGRFADSLRPLEDLQALIEKEYVREAMALSERGVAQAELGRFSEAGRLIALAVKESPGVPTRYLFARASTMLMRGDAAGVRAVAAEIRNQKIPQDSPQDAVVVQEAATRAAAYLDGMADLVSGNAAKAVEALSHVATLPGYQYSIYKLGLARALLADQKPSQALEQARAAAAERDPGDIRLDLELDRSRAMLLEAETLAAMGQMSAATSRARDFLQRWRSADSRQAERVRAERLARAPATASSKS
jgi:class 3 adenylate cyclase/tetratricopeptide (TPR) repeat protein/TolB-like protein